MGDVALLAGSPADANDHYSTAIELSRPAQDFVWCAAALEGKAHALVSWHPFWAQDLLWGCAGCLACWVHGVLCCESLSGSLMPACQLHAVLCCAVLCCAVLGVLQPLINRPSSIGSPSTAGLPASSPSAPRQAAKPALQQAERAGGWLGR